jgi:hypothetical protein
MIRGIGAIGDNCANWDNCGNLTLVAIGTLEKFGEIWENWTNWIIQAICAN